jgi:hypothetical protein
MQVCVNCIFCVYTHYHCCLIKKEMFAVVAIYYTRMVLLFELTLIIYFVLYGLLDSKGGIALMWDC